MRIRHILIFIVICYGVVLGQQWKQNFLVKKAGLATAQQDTVGGLTTLGQRITGNGTLADTLWYLTGTGKDTSRVYRSNAYMTLDIELDDTSSGGDSAAWRLIFYMSPSRRHGLSLPVLSDFVAVDTTTVTSEGRTAWIVTCSTIPNWDYWFIAAEGLAANKKASAVSGVIGFRSWEQK